WGLATREAHDEDFVMRLLEWSWASRGGPTSPDAATAARLGVSAGAKKGAQCTQRLPRGQHPGQAHLCSFGEDLRRGATLRYSRGLRGPPSGLAGSPPAWSPTGTDPPRRAAGWGRNRSGQRPSYGTRSDPSPAALRSGRSWGR